MATIISQLHTTFNSLQAAQWFIDCSGDLAVKAESGDGMNAIVIRESRVFPYDYRSNEVVIPVSVTILATTHQQETTKHG